MSFHPFNHFPFLITENSQRFFTEVHRERFIRYSLFVIHYFFATKAPRHKKTLKNPSSLRSSDSCLLTSSKKNSSDNPLILQRNVLSGCRMRKIKKIYGNGNQINSVLIFNAHPQLMKVHLRMSKVFLRVKKVYLKVNNEKLFADNKDATQ
jgi:hypothetical protein